MTDSATGPAPELQPEPPSPRVIREFNDRGTLWLLEDPSNVRDLIQLLDPDLAARLDVTSAERINRSFIPADLQKEESDLIFRIRFRDGEAVTGTEVLIYLLLEHQSRPDPLMPLRLYLYMGHLWDAQRREWEDAGRPPSELRLTPVLPIVFYTGRDAWAMPLTLEALMDVPPALQRSVPQWQTLFLPLHATSGEALTRFATSVGYVLRVLQAERSSLSDLEQVLEEALAGLEDLPAAQSSQWLRAAWYLVLLAYHRRSRAEYNELVQVIRAHAAGSKFHARQWEVDSMTQSMAEWVTEQAEARGEARGEAHGRLVEARAMLLRIGPGRLGTPEPAVITALEAVSSVEMLERLADRLLLVESWQELLHLPAS